jgi:hypothetical protein
LVNNNTNSKEYQGLLVSAEPLLTCPDVLGQVASALHKMGLAGQEREAKIIYLALTSRVLKIKVLVNIVVKGPSSGGKSYLVERVLDFFPLSAFYDLSAMSEKALVHSTASFSNRYLVIYEAVGLGGNFAQYLMRSLLSEGRIKYETVEKAQNGKSEKFNSRLIEREGPTGLIVTTTKAGLHPENETRMLTLEVSDTPQQTREVLLAHAMGEHRPQVDIAPFIAFQKLLDIERPQAIIPFAEQLARNCDDGVLRVRRDFLMVLNLIKAHAILHRAHREIDHEGRVIATKEDYRGVYDLVADLVAQGMARAVSPNMRETVEAVGDLLSLNNGKPLKVIEIAEKLGLDKSSALRRVRTAIREGYLVNNEHRRGRPAKISLGDPLPADTGVLPSPEIV